MGKQQALERLISIISKTLVSLDSSQEKNIPSTKQKRKLRCDPNVLRS
ncbi:hypothetical protein KO561_05155 [Radiobacillus kanasensis]|nr:hypothetical protein [Radiobacillus kanasensis]UFU00340.1 hypothetical protein KO561_05155 [Radiobacillus kanasensis]